MLAGKAATANTFFFCQSKKRSGIQIATTVANKTSMSKIDCEKTVVCLLLDPYTLDELSGLVRRGTAEYEEGCVALTKARHQDSDALAYFEGLKFQLGEA